MTSTYGNAGNTTKIEAKANGALTPLTSYSYSYTQGLNDRDVRQSVTDNVAPTKTVAYDYDASGRLAGADTSGGSSEDYSYAYDANGNRTTQVKGGLSTTYSYRLASNQLSGVSGQATAPTFDANGNQTKTHTDTGVVAAYNAKDQTKSFTPPGAPAINLTYADADSTEMTSAGPATLASGLRGVSRDARSGGSTYHYTRDPGGQLVSRRASPASTHHYYLFDGLGSVVGLVTTLGTLADNYRYTYDPYGNQTSAPPGLTNPWRYAGGLAMDDITTGTKLTKFGTRYYDPSVGRWTQQDPSGQEANAYAYVDGDPVNLVDPSGLIGIDDLLEFALDRASKSYQNAGGTLRGAGAYARSGYIYARAVIPNISDPFPVLLPSELAPGGTRYCKLYPASRACRGPSPAA